MMMKMLAEEKREALTKRKESKNQELMATAANAIKLARVSAEEEKAPKYKKKVEKEIEIVEE